MVFLLQQLPEGIDTNCWLKQRQDNDGFGISYHTACLLDVSSPLCSLFSLFRRLPVFWDVGDGVRPDLRCSDQRLILRRPRLGGWERPVVDGQVGLDRTADQAAFQERVAAGWFPTAPFTDDFLKWNQSVFCCYSHMITLFQYFHTCFSIASVFHVLEIVFKCLQVICSSHTLLHALPTRQITYC